MCMTLVVFQRYLSSSKKGLNEGINPDLRDGGPLCALPVELSTQLGAGRSSWVHDKPIDDGYRFMNMLQL